MEDTARLLKKELDYADFSNYLSDLSFKCNYTIIKKKLDDGSVIDLCVHL